MKRSLLALTLLAALPFAASAAEGLSYTYVEGGYVATDGDGADADGWGINGSGAIAENFHIFGGYTAQETDDFNVGPFRFDGVDVDQWRIGLGYNHPVASNTDLVARLAYENAEVDGIDDDLDGYSAEVGVRSALTTNFEGYAAAGYEDGNNFDGDFYGRLGAQVKFNQNWGVNGDVKFADGDTQWFVGPRFTF
ncbi:MAG TPA: diffusible signal factor-reguated Ax21 family protein [Lysobacter sp.]|nr:diffusible signal factor-reguated Ax21 family protein [Lysobacter sp.]